MQLLEKVAKVLHKAQFSIQTKRLCFSHYIPEVENTLLDQKDILLSMGSLSFEIAKKHSDHFVQSKNIAINLDLTNEAIQEKHVDFLYRIIQTTPQNTFRFTYGGNLPGSSPYFPSAKYEKNGFSIGLQPTNLAKGLTLPRSLVQH